MKASDNNNSSTEEYSVFLPHNGLGSSNILANDLPLTLLSDPIPLILMDHVYVDSGIYLGDDGYDNQYEYVILDALKDAGLIEILDFSETVELTPSFWGLLNETVTVLTGKGAFKENNISYDFLEAYENLTEDAKSVFELFKECWCTLSISRGFEVSYIQEEPYRLALLGLMHTLYAGEKVELRRGNHLQSYKGLIELFDFFSPSISVFVGESGSAVKPTISMLRPILGEIDPKIAGEPVSKKRSMEAVEKVIKLRHHKHISNFKKYLSQIQKEVGTDPEDSDHIKLIMKAHKKELSKINYAIASEIPNIDRFIRFTSFVSLATAVGGFAVPTLGLASLFAGIAAITADAAKERIINRRKLNPLFYDSNKQYSWYLFMNEISKYYSKNSLLQRIKESIS